MNEDAMNNEDVLTAADALSDHLEAENAAIAAFDLGRAARMLGGKTRLAATFRHAHAAGRATTSPALGESVARLLALIERNNLLLASAVEVQGRVVRIVAEAASRSAAPCDTRYGASGAFPAARARGGALFARA